MSTYTNDKKLRLKTAIKNIKVRVGSSKCNKLSGNHFLDVNARNKYYPKSLKPLNDYQQMKIDMAKEVERNFNLNNTKL